MDPLSLLVRLHERVTLVNLASHFEATIYTSNRPVIRVQAATARECLSELEYQAAGFVAGTGAAPGSAVDYLRQLPTLGD